MRSRLAVAELRQHPGRAAAVLLAVMISVGFVVACLTFVPTEQGALGAAANAPISRSHVVVQPMDEERSPAALIAAIRAGQGVRTAEADYQGSAAYRGARGPGQLTLGSVANDPSLRWARLVAGRWPQNTDEIILNRSAATHAGVALGGTLTLTDPDTDDNKPRIHAMVVVGLTDVRRSLLSADADSGLVTSGYFETSAGSATPTDYLIRTDPGVQAGLVAERLQHRLGTHVRVETSARLAQQNVQDLARGADVSQMILLVFGAIALLTGSIIIVNTFTILVVQRRRQLGLLRAIGASGRQVRHALLLESLIIGAVGSVAGVGLGVGLAALGATISGSIGNGLVIPWLGLVDAMLGGVLLTVAAAVLPARRATRVAPMDAVHPVAGDVRSRRNSRVRLITGLLAVLGGMAVLGFGLLTRTQPLLLAVGGSFLGAVGLFVLTPSLLPAVLRALARPADRLGAVIRLAGANSVRNPGRAAATCTALMVAVGLIVTLQVGAASMKATVLGALDSRFPIALTVRADRGALPASVVAALEAVPAVAVAVPVASTQVVITERKDFGPLTLQGPANDAARATTGDFADVADHSVLLSPFTARELSLRAGALLTFQHGGRRDRLTTRISDLPDDGTLLTSRTELARLDPKLQTGAVWASVPDVDRAGDVLAEVRQITAPRQDLTIGGSLEQTAGYTTLLNRLLAAATSLLGVAVLIAVIGVGNTLGLSVLERTRESALLRALGLQRRQLRAMLAVEAILLAVVGAVVGIAVGVGFGWLGTLAPTEQLKLGSPRFAMSAGQTVVVIMVALLAGALASVVPGRRAARATPIDALADL